MATDKLPEDQEHHIIVTTTDTKWSVEISLHGRNLIKGFGPSLDRQVSKERARQFIGWALRAYGVTPYGE